LGGHFRSGPKKAWLAREVTLPQKCERVEREGDVDEQKPILGLGVVPVAVSFPDQDQRTGGQLQPVPIDPVDGVPFLDPEHFGKSRMRVDCTGVQAGHVPALHVEMPETDLPIRDGVVRVSVKPYAIRTLRLTHQNQGE
jgi:hypothetical protein